MSDNKSQLEHIDKVNQADEQEIYLVNTGKEAINLPKHTHNKYQLIFTKVGTLHMEMGDTRYFIPEGHICVIPPGTPHLISTKNKQISLIIIYYSLAENIVQPLVLNSSSFILENLFYLAAQTSPIIRCEKEMLYNYTLAFLRMLPEMSNNYNIPLKAILWPKDERLQKILSYLSLHAEEDFRINEVAARFGFTDRSLSRLFQKSDISFNNFLNYQRIIRSMELLSEKTYSIQEVAYKTGFNTPNNFNRVFKRMTGINPKEYTSQIGLAPISKNTESKQ